MADTTDFLLKALVSHGGLCDVIQTHLPAESFKSQTINTDFHIRIQT